MALPIFGQVLNSSPEIPMQVNVFRESLLCICQIGPESGNVLTNSSVKYVISLNVHVILLTLY